MSKIIKRPACKSETTVEHSEPSTCPRCGTATFVLLRRTTEHPENPKPEWIILTRSFQSTLAENRIYEPVAIRASKISMIDAEQTGQGHATVHVANTSTYVKETIAEIWKLIHGETPVVLPPLWTEDEV